MVFFIHSHSDLPYIFFTFKRYIYFFNFERHFPQRMERLFPIHICFRISTVHNFHSCLVVFYTSGCLRFITQCAVTGDVCVPSPDNLFMKSPFLLFAPSLLSYKNTPFAEFRCSTNFLLTVSLSTSLV